VIWIDCSFSRREFVVLHCLSVPSIENEDEINDCQWSYHLSIEIVSYYCFLVLWREIVSFRMMNRKDHEIYFVLYFPWYDFDSVPS
jgi:uncharacterized membrane protein YagU involved in acid resistance